ncbi:MAG: nucleotidyltransferase family protein [Nanoarchaeota archaeon]|nr:nucleotidyltransferase family protein [Nanoarchaeota archaeon]
MKVIFLAGGYGTRLKALSYNTPKALLPLGGKPILDHLLAKVLPLKPTRIYVLTNKRFAATFEQWNDTVPSSVDVRIVVEPGTTEEKKLGAIGGLGNVIEQERLADDLLVLAADNYFTCDLTQIAAAFQQRKAPVVGLYDVKDRTKASNYGVVSVDRYGRIIGFAEKPMQPNSTLVSTGIYFLPREVLASVLVYLRQGKNPDAFGNFISWLSVDREVVGYTLPKGAAWFDIGSPETYEAAKAATGP